MRIDGACKVSNHFVKVLIQSEKAKYYIEPGFATFLIMQAMEPQAAQWLDGA